MRTALTFPGSSTLALVRASGAAAQVTGSAISASDIIVSVLSNRAQTKHSIYWGAFMASRL